MPTLETDRTYVYLSTYDFVWINTTVTGEANPYDYVVLEACMAGQYRYGDADDSIVAHAAPMFERLLLRQPFEEGNQRTALIALFTFLNTNGYAIAVSDAEAARLTLAVESGDMSAESAVATMAAPAKGNLGGVSLRKLVVHECNHHADALRLLADQD